LFWTTETTSTIVNNPSELTQSKDFHTSLASNKGFKATARLASVLFDSNTPFVANFNHGKIDDNWTFTPLNISDRASINASVVKSYKENRFLIFKFGYGNECLSETTMTVGAVEGTCFQDGDLSFTVYASGLSYKCTVDHFIFTVVYPFQMTAPLWM
jgi:hypothetical protein